MLDSKEKDKLFLFPSLIIWVLILFTSLWDIQGNQYSLNTSTNVAGVLIFFIGLVIRLSAAVSLKNNYSWTLEIKDEHSLVKNGLYKYVRHPIYLGTLLSAVSIPIFAMSFLGFLFVLTAIPLFIYRIGVEEMMLIEEYGDEYLDYIEVTWKLLPHIY